MLNILLVDDNPGRYEEFCKRICKTYTSEDRVDVATNQRDALKRFGEKRYDIAIIDMQLPSTAWTKELSADGGVKLLQHLLEDDELLTPKYVIGVTQSTDHNAKVSEFFASSPWALIQGGASGSDWQARLEQLVAHAMEVENAGAQREYGTDICIVTALTDPEQRAVISTPLEWDVDQSWVDSNTFVRTGRLHTLQGRPLSVVCASAMRMGSTEAALLSLKLIERYRPRILTMAGICAGLEGKTAYGDPILASQAWDWTCSKWDVDDNGAERILPSPDYIDVDREVVSRFRLLRDDKRFSSDLRDAWPASPPDTVLTLRDAPCASGPIVVADGKTLHDIRAKQNRDVLALEMEAYGVYCASRMASSPRPITFSIKSVCDFADPRKNDAMQKYASYTSARTVYEFLRRYAVELIDGQKKA
ncbi:phosphorylase family protein [Cupriavidus basilensis]